MIRRSTWVLLAAFALVLGGAMIWTRSRPVSGSTTNPEATPTLQPLWSVAATDIVGVRVENLQTGTVVEVRRGDEQTPWKLVAPENVAADASRLEWAVTSLVSPRPQGILDLPADLEPFGLAQPAQRVTVFLAGNVARSLEVGRVSPAGGVFYVLSPGTDGILLLNEYSLSDVLSLIEDIPYAATPTPEPTPLPPTETSVLPTGTPAADGG